MDITVPAGIDSIPWMPKTVDSSGPGPFLAKLTRDAFTSPTIELDNPSITPPKSVAADSLRSAS